MISTKDCSNYVGYCCCVMILRRLGVGLHLIYSEESVDEHFAKKKPFMWLLMMPQRSQH
jgi:hypothetical protein